MRHACDRSGSGREVWFADATQTQPAASPTCLLRAVKQARAEGRDVRSAYIPDAELGTRWFADKAVWVRDGDTFLPFTTDAAAGRYLRVHPAGTVVTYDRAVEEVRQ